MLIPDFNQESALIDHALGFRIDEIEHELIKSGQALSQSNDIYSLGKVLHQGNQTWVGLDPQTLQTPYHELAEILLFLNPEPGTRFVDLGAGYGRLGIALHDLAPESSFIGYEYVQERVEEAHRIFKKLELKNAQIFCQDILQENFLIPRADYYFIYDFGFPPQIREVLKRLEKMNQKQNLMVIARGKGIRSQISQEHFWLGGVHRPWHRENFSIYSNNYDLA